MPSELLANFPHAGRVEWIGIRPSRGEAMTSLLQVEAVADKGLAGDRTAAGRGGGSRQVTFLQAEHLPVLASFARREFVTPPELRRNIVVRGINLVALRDVRFRVGGAVLLGTGPCAPCSKMEAALGQGGLNAMRGHGGLTAKVLEGGPIAVGDEVVVLSPAPGRSA